MKKKIAIVSLIVLAGLGIWLYQWVLGTPESASGPIETIRVESPPAPQTDAQVSATPAPEATAEAQSTSSNPPAQPAASQTAGGPRKFQLVQQGNAAGQGTTAKFIIYEELRGVPVNVEGITNQVSAEISIDAADLTTAQVGVVQINARTLATDDDRRNNAIRNRILNTNEYEMIGFKPTQITGLSGAAAPGASYPVSITGDLTIREVMRPVVFQGTISLPAADRIAGKLSAKVNKSDFELVVPNLPFLAHVGEEVTLEIDFQAEAVRS